MGTQVAPGGVGRGREPGVALPPVVFRHTVEGLFKVALKGRVTGELERRLRLAGLELSRPLLPAYSYLEWTTFLRIAAEELWPGEPPDEAYRALGRQLVDGYARTLMGRAIVGLLRLLGPRRALERMAQSFGSGCNYNVFRLSDVGPQQVLLWINEPTFSPGWAGGIFEALLATSGASWVDVQVAGLDAEGCTYRIRWAE